MRMTLLATALASALAACGGSPGQEQATADALRRGKITVSVTPTTSAVAVDASQQFAATVTNTSNAAVVWSVEEGTTGGAVDSTGLYTAPASAGTFHVVATSVANPNKTGLATVTVSAPATIAVTVSPTSASLATGATQQFSATVSGTTNGTVAWTVEEGAAGGAVTSTGLYTAPSTPGTYHVVATSQVDTTKNAVATVTVTAPTVVVALSPTTASLSTGATRQFTATVTGTTNTAVSWSIPEGAAGGTISTSGLYTAPTTAGTYHVVATSVADPTKSASATVTVGSSTAPTDLCAGLVQDKANHAMTAVAKPALGQSFVDPQFGTVIRRISNASAVGASNIVPVYSTIQAWNADESYMVLYWVGAGTHHLYNGKTYAHIKALNINPADLEQVYWDLTDPKILYYTDGAARKLYAYNVDTDTATLVHDFSGICSSSLAGGVDPMWTSWGPHQVFGYVCGSKIFSYDRTSDTVGTIATVTTGGNAPMPGPSGSYFFLNANDTAAQVRNASMTLLGTLANVSSAEHATLGTSDGVDTLFSVQFDSYQGTVVASNLATRATRVIVGPPTGWPYPPSGTHLSAVSYKYPGWVAASIIGDTSGATTLNQEVILVNANTGGTVCRVAHHRSWATTYWGEPHVSISPSGTRLLFGSDWGGGATVDSYVVELPAYTP